MGTVEAEPELDEVILKVRAGGYKKVMLMPFMIVSGDHASNDMAGLGQDSWKNNFINEGFEVECIMKGLGEYSEIQSIFAEHVKSADQFDMKNNEIKYGDNITMGKTTLEEVKSAFGEPDYENTLEDLGITTIRYEKDIYIEVEFKFDESGILNGFTLTNQPTDF